MKVIYVTKRSKVRNIGILCLGIFDGVHLGHQYIIKKALASRGGRVPLCAVLTFKPHPTNLLNPKAKIKMLGTFRQRLALLEEEGVDLCLVIRFNKKFAHIRAQKFIEEILVRTINPEMIVVGSDFRFGSQAQGDVRLLARFAGSNAFRLKIIVPRKSRTFKISSSRIRRLLEVGSIEEANSNLGRPYSITGEVMRGEKIGAKIGFPTINIKYDPNVVLPLGIFSGFLILGRKRCNCLVYIGFKPTFRDKQKRPILEAHILGFRKNIYGKKVEVFLGNKIRSGRKFRAIKDLRQAIKEDIKKVTS